LWRRSPSDSRWKQGLLSFGWRKRGKSFGLSRIAWVLSSVEEVLGNPGIEDFIKSFREGSKVTITRRGENRSGRFLEVAVYGGGRRGRILFPEGWDGRGWSRVSGELSKILDFLGTTVGSSSSGGLPPFGGSSSGVKLGKVQDVRRLRR
jgi:hypothetical protein